MNGKREEKKTQQKNGEWKAAHKEDQVNLIEGNESQPRNTSKKRTIPEPVKTIETLTVCIYCAAAGVAGRLIHPAPGRSGSRKNRNCSIRSGPPAVPGAEAGSRRAAAGAAAAAAPSSAPSIPPAAAGAPAASGGAVLDPVHSYMTQGEAVLREELGALSAAHLRQIARVHRLVDDATVDLGVLSEQELAELIFAGVRKRSA